MKACIHRNNRAAQKTPGQFTLNELASGRLLLLPNGLNFVRWGSEYLIAPIPSLFDETAELPDLPRDHAVTPAGELWVGGAEAAYLRHLAGPRAGEAVALLQSDMGTFQWISVDRCSESKEIMTAGPISLFLPSTVGSGARRG